MRSYTLKITQAMLLQNKSAILDGLNKIEALGYDEVILDYSESKEAHFSITDKMAIQRLGKSVKRVIVVGHPHEEEFHSPILDLMITRGQLILK
jgi:DNA primase catalytic subunit